jgi:hypothetical protein
VGGIVPMRGASEPVFPPTRWEEMDGEANATNITAGLSGGEWFVGCQFSGNWERNAGR